MGLFRKFSAAQRMTPQYANNYYNYYQHMPFGMTAPRPMMPSGQTVSGSGQVTPSGQGTVANRDYYKYNQPGPSNPSYNPTMTLPNKMVVKPGMSAAYYKNMEAQPQAIPTSGDPRVAFLQRMRGQI